MRENIQNLWTSLAYQLPDEVEKYKMCGDYEGALQAIERWIKRPVPDGLKERLRLEAYFLERLPEEFPYTAAQVLDLFAGQGAALSADELKRLDEEGLAEWIFFRGEKHYIRSIFRNLTGMVPELRRRAGKYPQEDPARREWLAAIAELQEKGSITRHFRIRASIALKDEAFRPGEKLRAHLPVAAALPPVTEVNVLDYTGKSVQGLKHPDMRQTGAAQRGTGAEPLPDECRAVLDPADALYRAICFEAALQKNQEFFVLYEYTVHLNYHDLWRGCRKKTQRNCADAAGENDGEMPGEGTMAGAGGNNEEAADEPGGRNSSEAAEKKQSALCEQPPHISFTPYLRELAHSLAGEEKRPLELARRIYNYITCNVKYSYMRPYALLPVIPEYCARNLRGDCGVQALLFITLCRICGVPAKWQSGRCAQTGGCGAHDWAMFYAEPYGWLYADLSMGGSAFREGDEERRRFFFGNLDPFRMAANNAFGQPFSVPKRFMPIDPCDNQSGEIESENRGFTAQEVVSVTEVLQVW